jgi:hypothetical protein
MARAPNLATSTLRRAADEFANPTPSRPARFACKSAVTEFTHPTRSKARAGSYSRRLHLVRSDGPDFDEVRGPGWRDARDFESLRRQQVAPLVLGSLLAPDEDEHV